MKGVRIFRDSTTPFYNSTLLLVSNCLLTIRPECYLEPGVYHPEW